ncbi:MAG: hypothetical protein NTW31_05630 [Bacteroidetes bacterium]|nr:hypothetical protein [Bacteroidota bacterium]
MQAAQSLASKNICAFFLINDLTVFDALESVVRISKDYKKPIFANDADCLPNGAFLVFGYEYYISGVQAARLADRIIRGELPAKIPYEHYAHALLGINKDLAIEYGINVPDSLFSRAESKVYKGKYTRKEFRLPLSMGKDKPMKLAMFQYANNLVLDRCVQGFRDVMIREKYLHGRKMDLVNFNSQGDYANAQAVARDIVSKDFDYIATFSSIVLQTMAGVNTRIPHVFSAVTDPVKAGVASSLTDHRPNLTGIATPQPVASTIRLMRALLPLAKKIGIIWNTSEVNSEICTRLAREACRIYGFRLLERTITGTNEIDEAIKSLLDEGMDIFYVSGDVTTSQVIPVLAKLMRERKIPFFTNTSDDIKSGTMLSYGADYYEVGKKAAGIMLGIMDGAAPADIPIELYVPEALAINLAIAREEKISIPDSIMKKATIKLSN